MQLIILYFFKNLKMKFCKKILVSFVSINIFFSVHSVAQTTDDLEQMIRSSKTRAALVQNVQKAVVHIKVEKIVRGSNGRSFNNPMDLYNDEFFRRFFPELNPPKNNQQREQPNREFRQKGMGSGSIIDSEGYILTNHPVSYTHLTLPTILLV